jgi:3-hydroxyacyl-CoA dehydrogenase/enoyl-CoA hydratase/3-hydroxybutyryl-CoA epimerase
MLQGTAKTSLRFTEGGTAIIDLGSAEEHVVTLNAERLESLRANIAEARAKLAKGLVIIGPSEGMFCAGADISLIGSVTSQSEGEHLASLGQKVFDEIEALSIPTVAAISGPCVGGGCELALACKYRIISNSPKSLIGLPETKLGIIPGFGGTQRLPRLIGLPAALDIILAGKTLRAKKAKDIGLADEMVGYDKLLDTAIKVASGALKLKRKPIGFVNNFLTFSAIGRSIVENKTKKLLAKQTKGFYPAPPTALNAATYGLKNGQAAGMKYEAAQLGRMIVSPESKALVNLFFLSEGAKGLGKSARSEIKGLFGAVIGAGTMGAGIAEILAQSEHRVILHDKSEESINKGLALIRKDISKISYLSESEKNLILNRVERHDQDAPVYGSVNFVVEAVFEDMNLKKKILGDMSKKVRNDAIIATNTSSLSVTEIASAIDKPERVIGMHFFNPVPKMPLVEIIRAEQSSPKTIAMTAALATKLGKFPIVVNDVPGFLVNRILFPYLNEAMYMVMDGYNIVDIDKAALKFGMPMGPLRLLDEVGLDVGGHVAEIMHNGYGERMAAPPLAALMDKAGRKGRKNGKGFYDYNGKEETPFAGLRTTLNITKTPPPVNYEAMAERLLFNMINEAVRCLDEGVAGQPGKEAANQVDLGSVMGFGFPPFRGGILFYADTVGAAKLHEKLEQLAKDFGPRFTPWQGIAARIKSGKNFH